jgi:P27 family predicted phage terminase small subunit
MEVKGKAVCPPWLDEYAKATWKKFAPLFVKLGTLTAADEIAFAGWCQCYAEFKIATKDVQDNGRNIQIPIQTREGEVIGYDRKANPAVKQQQAALESMRRYASEFGGTAISRARLETTGGDDGDELDEFLGGNRKSG